MTKFRRETATHQQDLPHEFTANAERGSECNVCLGQPEDARHRAWEAAQVATREQAAEQAAFQREVGS